ncbi:MAG: flagellar biosynthetic protein FliO [Rhizobiales bacterium]|nr:flagellar biosynthetic protein FliO [Hyphomicrobiales bacterium]
MIDQVISEYGLRLVIAVLGVGVGFVCLIGVLWLLRGRRGPSPFIRGGRNRQPRLQVLDAAAVDARRRLVLVRRDDVEHLIMIGGPTDIVIESGISVPADISAEAAIAAKARPRAQRDAAQAPPPATPAEDQGRQKTKPADPAFEAQALSPQPTVPIPAAPRSAAPPVSRTPPSESSLAAATKTPPPVEPIDIRREPALTEAADILDAARGRVFQGPTQPVRAVPANPGVSDAAPPKSFGSDFERILEEEMASNLAAGETAPQAFASPAGEKPRVTGARPEPSLQDEMARIFGEMSVTRDK